MTVYSLLLDFSFASILIMFGQLLRAKVPLFQKFFIPSSLLAGFLGLALGPQGMGVIPFSKAFGSYAGMLTIIIFAGIGINGLQGSKSGAKAGVKRVVTYQMYRISNVLLQYGVPAAFTILVISKLYPDVNYGFSMLLAAGFAGGHGTAAAVGAAFKELGFVDATDLAMTSATVGLLAGVLGGLAFIKWGTSRGYTAYIKDFSYITGELRTGLVEKKNRQPIGLATISSVALDPIAWHLSVLLVPSGLGYLLNTYIKQHFGITAPHYSVAFIIAFAMFFLLRGVGAYEYIDRSVINRLSGTVTDYLVFFGVASIKIPIVIKYAGPLILLFLCGFVLVALCMILFGPAFNEHSWFERSIFVYGYSTGVFAIGFILLRIVDPENRSKTLGDIALTSPLNESIAVVILSTGPVMLMMGQHWLYTGVLLLGALGCILFSMIIKAWYLGLPLSKRTPMPEENASNETAS